MIFNLALLVMHYFVIRFDISAYYYISELKSKSSDTTVTESIYFIKTISKLVKRDALFN